MKVLIVDDDAGVRKTYKQACLEAGFQVFAASSARMAVNVLNVAKVDLVVLDLKMPFVDGMSVSDVIEHDDPRMKVIVSSAYPVFLQQKLIPKAAGYHDKADGPQALVAKAKQAMATEIAAI